ncbi:hydroxyphenylacetyl-CoA thioesterase PaaI [Microbacterium sp. NPDC057659]|uniref:hydroxyphenylacetyl-CoA thioesterase PaaI n=1 Tax=Microbacterium sp. NPDC057659 TaxID=3346198 RepID=UPI00366AC52C
MVNEMDPQRLAEACAERMWSTDTASQALGMSIQSVGPGRATLAMTVRDDMVNGHGICHGGLISALADSTFAFACNSRGTVTVAAGFEVDFIAPVALGERLVAEGRETVLRGRSGIYDVEVRRDDTVVAVFRGRSRSLGRPVLEDS